MPFKPIVVAALMLGIATPASLAAETIEKFASCGEGFLEGAVLDKSGQLWAVDIFAQTVLRIDEGACTVAAKLDAMPNGAKFRDDGILVVTTHGGLYTFDPETSETAVLLDSFEGQPLTGLNDLAFDAEGGLYFTAPGASGVLSPTGRVFYMAPGASAPEVLADNVAFPNGIAVSPDQKTVLVAEFAAKRLLSLPAHGEDGFVISYVFAHTQGGVGPDGIAFDAQGNLFVANIGAGKITMFAPNGELARTIALPEEAGLSVTNIAVGDGVIYVTEVDKGEIWKITL